MKRCTFTIEEIKFRSRPDTVNDCWIWTGARDAVLPSDVERISAEFGSYAKRRKHGTR